MEPEKIYAIKYLDAWFSLGVPSTKETWKNGESSTEVTGMVRTGALDLWGKAWEAGILTPVNESFWGFLTAAPRNYEEDMKMTEPGNSMSLWSYNSVIGLSSCTGFFWPHFVFHNRRQPLLLKCNSVSNYTLLTSFTSTESHITIAMQQ